MEIRRIALRGIVAAPLVLGAGAAAWLWLPKVVRAQLVARLEKRTGLSVSVPDVSLGFGSVAVREIALGGGTGGPSLRARNVTIDASPIMLALRGTRALHAVHVGEVVLRLPLQTASTQQLLQRLRERDQASGAAADARDTPALQIDQIALELGDAEGQLLRVSGASAHLDAEGAQLRAERVQLGAAPGHMLELERVTASAKRDATGLRLARAGVARARLRLAEQIAAEAANAAADETETGEPAPPAAPPRLTIVARLAALMAGPKSTTTAPLSPRDEVPTLLARLTDTAVLDLDGATVESASGGGPILTGLRARVAMQKGHTLAFSGGGKARGEGAISWDLSLRPEEVRADGQVVLRSLPLTLLAPFLPAVPWYEPENGRVDAELVIKTEPQGIAFSGDASLRDAALSSPRIAAIPVHGIDLAARGRGRFLPLAHRLEVDDAEVELGAAAVQLSGAVEKSADHYLFDLEVSLPPTPCTKAVRAVPEDLLGDMAAASWQGKLSGHVHVKLDSRALDDTELTITPVDHCEFETVPALADLRRFRLPFVHSVLEPDGTLFEMETGPGTPEWTFLEDISPYFAHAVMAHEDAAFFTHHGFSMRHIRDALVRNLKAGRYVVGASTITMQLVKNVFLHREKTLGRKIQEVLLTWWLERVMEKRDILELYLNVIEYGPAVYGIRNAAKHYFNRLPSQLSPAESCFLASILPNPKRYHSFFEKGSLSPGFVAELRQMLKRMRERGWYSPEAADYGLSELQAFHFAPEGTIVAARQIPGHAAPLPYMQSFQQRPGFGDDREVGGSTEQDDGSFEPRPPLKARVPAAQHTVHR